MLYCLKLHIYHLVLVVSYGFANWALLQGYSVLSVRLHINCYYSFIGYRRRQEVQLSQWGQLHPVRNLFPRSLESGGKTKARRQHCFSSVQCSKVFTGTNLFPFCWCRGTHYVWKITLCPIGWANHGWSLGEKPSIKWCPTVHNMFDVETLLVLRV